METASAVILANRSTAKKKTFCKETDCPNSGEDKLLTMLYVKDDNLRR